MKKFLYIVFILIFSVGCSAENKEMKKYELSLFDAFDTYTVFTVYEDSEEKAQEDLDKIKDKYEYYHKIFDGFNNYEGLNNLKTINDNAGVKSVVVDEELYNLIDLTLKLSEKTDKLNIAIGPVTELWSSYRDLYNEGKSPEEVRRIMGAEIPSDEDLEALRGLINQDDILLNEEEKSVFLKKRGMKIDLGSVAKGYATERVAEFARDELGIESLVISAGGNVRFIGKPPDREKYKVAIAHPEEGQDYLAVLEVDDTSVVTSGNYQRFFMYNGKRYSHIIDPFTLRPSENYRSMSVITEDSFIADFLSTVLFLTEEKDLEDVMNEFEVGALWMNNDGAIHSTQKAGELMED
ncbi:thiamin biosynthesis lipoprotein [Peptoniphilus sp. ING2-D1G]|nr:thiamin biosynthesis lipoprotein [Peptoniphilus sp. ING2-D1G]